jgi:hypothetical protein
MVIGSAALAGLLAAGGTAVTAFAVVRMAFGDMGGAARGAASGFGALASGIGMLTTAAAPLLAMRWVTNWAKDTTHDQERVETARDWSDGIRDMLPNWAGNPTSGATSRYMAARRELDTSFYVPAPSWPSPIAAAAAAAQRKAGDMSFDTVRPPPLPPIHVNVVNKLDARGLTTLVTQGQVAAVGSAALGTYSFDSQMAMPSMTGGR